MTTYCLSDMVEAFPASDGHIYFLRGGTNAEHVLEDPSDTDRRVLELLHRPRSRGELLGAAVEERELDELLDGLGASGLLDVEAPGPGQAALGLAPELAARFDRQLPYFGSSAPARGAAQRRLSEATVAIVGCGALGSWTAAGLACAGVGRLVLVDDDTVELSNLNRQLLFRRSDVGRPKVEAAADALSAFDPGLDVVEIERRVRSEADVEAVASGADLIVATADDPPYAIERWVNAVGMRHGIPHVSASQIPPYVRVGPLVRPGVTGCVSCQHIAGRAESPDFDALLSYRETHRRSAVALGPLAALVGAVLSTDAMHLLTGTATPATEGTAIIVDARDLSMEREPVAREPGCELGAEAQPATAQSV